jgi:hypothetical protein
MAKYHKLSLGELSQQIAYHLYAEEPPRAQAIVDACVLLGIPVCTTQVEKAYAALAAQGVAGDLDGIMRPRPAPQRNGHIIELRQDGWTLQGIGDIYDITRERVRQILEEEQDARA